MANLTVKEALAQHEALQSAFERATWNLAMAREEYRIAKSELTAFNAAYGELVQAVKSATQNVAKPSLLQRLTGK